MWTSHLHCGHFILDLLHALPAGLFSHSDPAADPRKETRNLDPTLAVPTDGSSTTHALSMIALPGPGGDSVTHRRELLESVSSPRQQVLDLLTVRDFLFLPEDLTEDLVTSRRVGADRP